jgi:hypothetical protein
MGSSIDPMWKGNRQRRRSAAAAALKAPMSLQPAFLGGLPSAKPAYASPATFILEDQRPFAKKFPANGNLSRFCLSQVRGSVYCLPQAHKSELTRRLVYRHDCTGHDPVKCHLHVFRYSAAASDSHPFRFTVCRTADRLEDYRVYRV